MNPSTDFTQFTAPAADPEAVLFGRLVALVLSWPCKRCGQMGICQCYGEPSTEDSVIEAVRQGPIEKCPAQP
jgi:hypothetical protein